MKQTIMRGAGAIIKFMRSRPKETRWSIYGAAVGVLIGLFVGGIGVAALGGAIPLSAPWVLSIIGGMIGNRVGVEKDISARREEVVD